jgi:hypothetical protein
MNIFCKIVMVVMINVSSSMMYGMDGATSNRVLDSCCQENSKDQQIEVFIDQALQHGDTLRLSAYLYDYPKANEYAEKIVKYSEHTASQERAILQEAQKMAWQKRTRAKL